MQEGCAEAKRSLGYACQEGHAADPDALGGWFAQVDAGGTTADGYRHGLVVLALDGRGRGCRGEA